MSGVNFGDIIFQLFFFLFIIAIPLFLLFFGVLSFQKARTAKNDQLEALTEKVKQMDKKLDRLENKRQRDDD